MSTAGMTLDEIHAGLIAWAEGSYPHQAAVEFLIGIGTLYPGHPMLERWGDKVRLDVYEVDKREWARRVGTMSGGEWAGWTLVRSILAGELGDCLWRLDGERSRLLLAALERNHY